MELKNGNAFLKYYLSKYRKKHGVNYNVNWKRDMVHMNKLLARIGADKLKEIVDIYFEDFDELWSTPQYPRETIGSLSAYNADNIYVTLEERRKERRKERAVFEKYKNVEINMADFEFKFYEVKRGCISPLKQPYYHLGGV